jgi:GntR family transcriptional regulator, transcriptional repressor for pyruvate dehydrogenase complex
MEDRMIQAQAMAARMACMRMTIRDLAALQDSVDRASGPRDRSQWNRKATAHAEFFGLLASMVDDPLLAPLLAGGAAHASEAMLAVGHAADGMIVSSRRRLLAHIRGGDGEAAASEMEKHLRGLFYMWRLALPGETSSAELA